MSTLKLLVKFVDALIDLVNTDKVYTLHDDHLELKDELSDDFLNTPLGGADNSKFESEIESFMEQENTIISLSERELTEDDMEEIKEDKISRGENFSVTRTNDL